MIGDGFILFYSQVESSGNSSFLQHFLGNQGLDQTGTLPGGIARGFGNRISYCKSRVYLGLRQVAQISAWILIFKGVGQPFKGNCSDQHSDNSQQHPCLDKKLLFFSR